MFWELCFVSYVNVRLGGKIRDKITHSFEMVILNQLF